MHKPILNKWITKATWVKPCHKYIKPDAENSNRSRPAQQTVLEQLNTLSIVCAVSYVCLLLLRYIPPHKFKPMEAIVEGVVSCQSALTILLVGRSHFSSTVVHLSHLVQPLPANDDTQHYWEPKKEYMESVTTNVTQSRTSSRCGRVVTWVYPGTNSVWLHSSGPEPLQPPQCEGKAWCRALSLALATGAQGAAENTACLSATQTGTGPEKWKRCLAIQS